MNEGTRVIIDGVPYIIVSAIAGTLGRHVLIVKHDTSTGTDLRESMSKLMDALENESHDKFAMSKLIINWFIDEKLKAGINTNQILAIKSKPTAAEGQIRRLMKAGSPVEEIIEVLAFSITDKFWSGILNTSINTIATPRQDGLTLYQKIKSKMITSRHSEIGEIHQTTDEDMEGVIVTE